MVTGKRDLRTGRTYWQGRRAAQVVPERLPSDHEAEVLVIGAGMSGSLIAQALAADGHAVTVVDRRPPARGSTSASTALVQFEIDEPLSRLVRRRGEADAVRAWRRSYQAVANLAAQAAELGLDEVERRPTLYLSGDVLDGPALEREAEWRRAAGIETFHLSPAEVARRFGIRRRSALYSHGSLALDPRKLALAHLRDAIDRGARLFCACNIVDVDARARSVVASTATGKRIRAGTVIFATGYEFATIVPTRGHKVISTYAMATRRQRRKLWADEAFIWEASNPYLYMRTTPDGRVIAGGEDEDFTDEHARDALIDRKVRRIGEKLARLFPELDVTPDYAWAGAFGASEDGLPSIGRIPGHANCWAVLGYGGNGITYSRIAAEIIRTTLGGRDDPDADLYAFSGG